MNLCISDLLSSINVMLAKSLVVLLTRNLYILIYFKPFNKCLSISLIYISRYNPCKISYACLTIFSSSLLRCVLYFVYLDPEFEVSWLYGLQKA